MKQFKRNAFTLIELLAVIIILAIVALIATPIILDVVDDARKSAGLSESNMIYSSINNYCAAIEMKKQLGTLDSEDVDCSGKTSFSEAEISKMVNLGNATVDKNTYNGNKLTELVIISNNHKFTLCPSGTFVMDDEKCDEEETQSGSLISTLLKQYQDGNSVGLVKDETNPSLYYYTGTNEEVANNFLWYGGHQWRVLDFDIEADTLTLISQQPLTAIRPASSVWTSEETYNTSYINKWLNEYFWNSLDSNIQSNIKDSTFNIGIYTDVDEITITKRVGLLDEEQYTRAGADNSFLDIKDNFWLGNRLNETYIRFVYYDGKITNHGMLNANGVRPVIKIQDIFVDKGNGTISDSFVESNDLPTIDNVQVGEYINVPYNGDDNACGSDNMCTFRVVSKSNDSIKVVLNGLLPTTSLWADNTNNNITTNDLIYKNVLNGFINNVDSKYITTGTYGVGMYEEGNSYIVPQSTTITTNIGLPTVGEMFSGNDIDMAYPADEVKTFVDVNTIENPTASYDYWTMNRYDSYFAASSANYNGELANYSVTYKRGVRPVIYLKSDTSSINFSGGEGTAQSPYILH